MDSRFWPEQGIESGGMAVQMSDYQRDLLLRLYEAFFTPAGTVNINVPCRPMAPVELSKEIAVLTDALLIKQCSLGGEFELTALGVLRVEELGLMTELKSRNSRVRTQVMQRLAMEYDDKGPGQELHCSSITCDETDRHLVLANLNLLAGLGLLGNRQVGCFHITPQGLERVRDLESRQQLANEFKRIEAMAPQVRGRELNRYVCEVLERQGWEANVGVRTSNEEIDVVVHQGREYFLIECKWEKSPVEAAVLRELNGKLMSRVDVRGIVLSMSGFSRGAEEEVVRSLPQRVVLLFGEADARALFSGKSFDEMLDEKYKSAIVSRRVLWS